MPKVRRFSGRLKIELSYNDRTDKYSARICPMVRGEPCEKLTGIGLPRTGAMGPNRQRVAVDSPRAFDYAARNAIAFASERIQEFADYGADGNYRVTKPRRGVR